MKQRKSNYWRKRYKLLEEARYRDNEKLYKEIEKEYIRAAKKIEKEILSFYNRFALNNGITLQEARKLLNSDELEELRWDVWEYIDKGIENSITGSWKHELENASIKARVRRLEALKLKMDAIISELQSEVLEQVDNHITDIYENSYYHTAFELQKGVGVGVDLAPIDVGRVALIKSKPWASDGLSFSERIWGKHRLELTKYLDTELTQSIIRGEDPQKLINKISKKFNTTKRRAGNVVMTESAYFASVAQEECYKDLDVDRYEIVATLDTKTSKICQDMDGEVFDMNEYEPWVTAPPFHNFCRTVTAPYFEDFTEGSKRWYRDADGNTGYVDADMKYNEWYDKYIENSMEEEYTEIVNDFENEKEYRSTVIDENSNGDIVKNGEIIIKAKKLKNSTIDAYKDIYAEEIKPKYMHDYINNFKEAAKKLKIDEDEIPPIYFCGNETFKKGENIIGEKVAYASYNPRLNILKVNTKANYMFFERKNLSKLEEKIRMNKKRLQEISSIQSERELTNAEKEEREKILSEKIMSYENIPKEKRMAKLKTIAQKMAKKELEWTCIHEIVHYADAKLYREKNKIGKQMTKEEADGWTNWSRKKAIEFFEKENIGYDDIKEISVYAKKTYLLGMYEEVYAEYIAKKIMEG